MSLVGKAGAASSRSKCSHLPGSRDPKMGWLEDRAMKEFLFFTLKP